ncbi:MAG TPA: hypothetical protein VF590_01245 [Isosphaeraceae bacterium]|jgi:hypothetical protein
MSQGEPTFSDLADLPRPRPWRLSLGRLIVGIAILELVLALAVQHVVLQRKAAALERWGASLRQRERYLRQRGAAPWTAASDRRDAPDLKRRFLHWTRQGASIPGSGGRTGGAAAADEPDADPIP